jgi:hypothetical protein
MTKYDFGRGFDVVCAIFYGYLSPTNHIFIYVFVSFLLYCFEVEV